MNEISTIELKSVQLEMLRYLVEYFNENNLKYSLAFGTLLGAVRHHGYIPWDDDIDIMMPRDDYNIFVKLFNGVSEKYKVLSYETNSKYVLPFAKVSDEDTILIEHAEFDFQIGVNIDVFPVDRVPNNRLTRVIFFYFGKLIKAIHMAKIISIRRNRSVIKNGVLVVIRLLTFFLTTRYLTGFITSYYTIFNKREATRVGIYAPFDSKFENVFRGDFENPVWLDFEDLKCCCISDFESYLSSFYGDYMTLPPIEKRVSHHDFEAFWKSKR